ncbi:DEHYDROGENASE RELATED [Salix purpurea]|uniref:pyruvate dehydrogenase (acetyl-transferring) n=1 Tax=Salix purpurea TaxID=77065 RepID=A0A9Q0WFH1_SALPP|nr:DEHYDROGENASE RELATED [Salix purpurea]
MATIFQGLGGAGAAAAAALTSSFNSKKLLLPSSRRSPAERKASSLLVVRSDGSVNLNLGSSNGRARRVDQLITNAVATKADTSSASSASKPGHELLLFEALREGLEEEMDRDPHVCVMGEDVGLAEKYGDLRVLDTPIAENSFTRMGIGAAVTGLRPIVEGMNMGFLLLAFNQISNICGMIHYTSGGQFPIPIVIRGPGGVGRQLGAEHSQRLDENPVILFEHVLLYNLKERIPDEEYICNLEEAEMVRPGEHVTILTYSRMRYHAMKAAKTLVNKGYDPEVIDIRSLKPFDLHMIGRHIVF